MRGWGEEMETSMERKERNRVAFDKNGGRNERRD